MSLRMRLLHMLRVPHAPSAPAGDEDVRIFRAAPNFLRYQLLLWGLKQAGGIVGLIIGLGFLRFLPNVLGGRFTVAGITITPEIVATLLGLLEIGAILGFIFQAVTSFLLLRLDFEQRWYIMSDRSLRIREGLVRLHEKTMTFANIQQVTTRQGPLQRLLGIADLQVRTAGGGGHKAGEEQRAAHDDLHVAYFRGVADAEGIRNSIRERLRRHADSGLGDPDDRPDAASLPGRATPGQTDSPYGLLSAARALADEARALRAHLSSA